MLSQAHFAGAFPRNHRGQNPKVPSLCGPGYLTQNSLASGRRMGLNKETSAFADVPLSQRPMTEQTHLQGPILNPSLPLPMSQGTMPLRTHLFLSIHSKKMNQPVTQTCHQAEKCGAVGKAQRTPQSPPLFPHTMNFMPTMRKNVLVTSLPGTTVLPLFIS